MAAARPDARGVYVAYNKAIADDAKKTFPEGADCRTAHGFAYRWIANVWGREALQTRLNGPRVPAVQSARILGINEPLRFGPDRMVTSHQLARITLETTGRFCTSGDTEISQWHVPRVNGVEENPDRSREGGTATGPQAWEDLTQPRGELKYNHDCYLKIWALTDPTWPGDYVLLDEAQGSAPVVAKVFNQQAGAQKVAVGDACQAIYGWRGAMDAMTSMVVDERLYLTQSFRFGPAVAEEANKWLELLKAGLRLKGTPTIASTLRSLRQPNAVLCRSNAEAVTA